MNYRSKRIKQIWVFFIMILLWNLSIFSNNVVALYQNNNLESTQDIDLPKLICDRFKVQNNSLFADLHLINNTNKSYFYLGHNINGSPHYHIECLRDNKWKSILSNWCLFGIISQEIQPGQIIYFSVPLRSNTATRVKLYVGKAANEQNITIYSDKMNLIEYLQKNELQ